MKRLLKPLLLMLACVMLAAQPAMAEPDRHGSGRGAHHSGTSSVKNASSGRRPSASGLHARPAGRPASTRPAHSGSDRRPQNSGFQRPDRPSRPTGVGRPGSISRPSSGHNTRPGTSTRPDNRPNNRPNGGAATRPDNRPNHRPNGGAATRPDNRPNNRPNGGAHRPGVSGNYRPGHNRPSGGHRPGGPGPARPPHNGYRPGGHGPGHGYGHVPPPPMPWRRPTPPPRWRPPHGTPSVATFLGITFGTALAATLSQLAVSNVPVAAYDNSAILLQNVSMYSVVWPEARMLYNNGVLYGSQFVYPTSYYDPAFYDRAYANLVNTYGYPVSYTSLTNGYSSTWFGGNGGFITLSFQPGIGADGRSHYFTTLSIGN